MEIITVKITGSVACPPYNLGHFVGDVVELTKEKALMLIQHGRAVQVDAPAPAVEKAVDPVKTEKRKR